MGREKNRDREGERKEKRKGKEEASCPEYLAKELEVFNGV